MVTLRPYLITLPGGVILDPHPVKPANIADNDKNGEKGDPLYQGVVFGTTEMPLEMKDKLKKIFEDTKIARGMASRNNNSYHRSVNSDHGRSSRFMLLRRDTLIESAETVKTSTLWPSISLLRTARLGKYIVRAENTLQQRIWL